MKWVALQIEAVDWKQQNDEYTDVNTGDDIQTGWNDQSHWFGTGMKVVKRKLALMVSKILEQIGPMAIIY